MCFRRMSSCEQVLESASCSKACDSGKGSGGPGVTLVSEVESINTLQSSVSQPGFSAHHLTPITPPLLEIMLTILSENTFSCHLHLWKIQPCLPVAVYAPRQEEEAVSQESPRRCEPAGEG